MAWYLGSSVLTSMMALSVLGLVLHFLMPETPPWCFTHLVLLYGADVRECPEIFYLCFDYVP